MTAEIVEKGDGVLVVKYTASSALEAGLMAMATMNFPQKNLSIDASSGYGGGETVRLSGISVPVIEMLREKK